MLEACGRADVVTKPVTLTDAVEGDSPTMAVRSSVVVDEVAVAFCSLETLVASAIIEVLLDAWTNEETRLLAVAVLKDDEEACADMHCNNRAQGRREAKEETIRIEPNLKE